MSDWKTEICRAALVLRESHRARAVSDGRTVSNGRKELLRKRERRDAGLPIYKDLSELDPSDVLLRDLKSAAIRVAEAEQEKRQAFMEGVTAALEKQTKGRDDASTRARAQSERLREALFLLSEEV